MNEFRQNFLREFLEPLGELRERVSFGYSASVGRDAMRLVHSVKGCSRTFGLQRAADIAAGLESILSDGSDEGARQANTLEQLALLIEVLKRPELAAVSPGDLPRRESVNRVSSHFVGLDTELFDQLTPAERGEFLNALDSGSEPFLIRERVDYSRFAQEFREIRTRIDKTADVIAVLPSHVDDPETSAVLVVAACRANNVPDAGDASPLRIAAPDPAVAGIVHEAGRHVSRLAAESSKSVRFRAFANDCRIAGLKRPVFETILHLASNAVDHGIIESGAVELSLLAIENGLRLTFADDGSGIENDGDDFGSLFDPGFTTAAFPGANSGRGYGLFIVKSEVERLNGKISVKSRKDLGTRFEITLPF